MQIFFTVADDHNRRHHDVVVRAGSDATVGEVVGALGGDSLSAADWCIDGLAVSGQERLAEWIHDGTILSRGEMVGSRTRTASNDHVIELRAIGGPAAGYSWKIPLGTFVIGRSEEADICLSGDELVSRRHAVLTVADGAVSIGDLGSVHGVVIDDAVHQSAWVAAGEPFQLGESILTWTVPANRQGVVVFNPEGGMTFNRPPRIIDPIEEAVLQYPGDPPERQKSPFPVIAIIAPVVMGVVLAVALHKLFYLAFTALSPIMVVGNYVSTNRRGKNSYKSRQEAYTANLESVRDQAWSATVHETQVLRTNFPDPATVSDVATGPESRLWERRPTNPDFLVLRFGLTDRPASVVVGGDPPADDFTLLTLRQVPATVDLREVGVLGVAGARPSREALARMLVAQACAFHAPDDLVVTVLTGPEQQAAWSWARWLPHVRPDEAGHVARIGSTDSSLDRLAVDLADLVDRRLNSHDAPDHGAIGHPAHLVVLDGAYRLGSIPALTRVLRLGPSVGVYSICVDETERLLPEECQAAALFSGAEPTRLALRTSQSAPVADVLADLVDTGWAEHMARALAPIRLNRRNQIQSTLPDTLRLLGALDLEDPTGESVAKLWTRSGRTTAAVIGADTRGQLVLDLALDGPHGLVAGTTGSGKSELLQTIIASLALVNRPDALTFVLVDYKGGSAFKDCAELPHTVGMVTDLDGHLTERALASLGAELRRRERLLQETGTKDIEDFWRATDGTDRPALARLVLVIDEFAAMVEELPTFVEGLVDLARRGRSLGIHLLLATQRPSGVVSPAIKTNTNLRIAMRVTDAADSIDVIDSPLAARIPKAVPGRGYLRIGHEHLAEFQAARVGGRRSVSTGSDLDVTEVPWLSLGEPLPRQRTTNATADDTDLSVLVRAIGDAARLTGVVVPASPWLPPLPEQAVLATSPQAVGGAAPGPSAADGGLVTCTNGHAMDADDRFCDACGAGRRPNPPAGPPGRAPGLAPPPPGFGPLTAIFGIEDRPDIQAQHPACWDVEAEGHLLVVGDPGSGRSMFLRTLAGSLADRTSAKDVHLYGIDCGNGALLPLGELPHCGAVVARTDVDRVDRLVSRLLGEIVRRQEVLSIGGFSTIADQRAAADAADRLPYLVVMIDRWEGFMAEFEGLDTGRLVSSLLHVMKEAPGVGIRVVATGDRTALSARFSSLMGSTIVLRMNDRGSYSMAGLNPRKLPDELRPGQGFRADSGTELQVALLDRDPSGPAQAAAFRAIAAGSARRDAALEEAFLPVPIGALPKRVPLADLLDGVGGAPGRGTYLLAGIGGDRAEPQWIDLGVTGPSFLVGGPPRSGRSNALRVIAQCLAKQDQRVLLVLGRPSPLASLAGRQGIVGVVDGRSVGREDFAEMLTGHGVTTIVVDDAEQLGDSPIGDPLATFVRDARDHGHAFIAGGSTQELSAGFRGFIPEARKSHTGLLLCPGAPADGELVGSRLPRTAVFPGPPGRAALVTREALLLVQVPLDDQVVTP